jgi:hypothetical protein
LSKTKHDDTEETRWKEAGCPNAIEVCCRKPHHTSFAKGHLNTSGVDICDLFSIVVSVIRFSKRDFPSEIEQHEQRSQKSMSTKKKRVLCSQQQHNIQKTNVIQRHHMYLFLHFN